MGAEGVEFRTNAHVGGNVPVEDIAARSFTPFCWQAARSSRAI